MALARPAPRAVSPMCSHGGRPPLSNLPLASSSLQSSGRGYQKPFMTTGRNILGPCQPGGVSVRVAVRVGVRVTVGGVPVCVAVLVRVREAVGA